MTHLRTRAFVATVLVALLTIASCTPTTTTPTSTTTATGAPATGGQQALRPELRLAVTSFGNENLDPIKALTDNERFLKLIFDPLVGSDRKGEEISKETGVAQDWTISPDGKTYTFKVRQGIKFHNGDDLTAEDVKFSLDRYETPEATTPNTSRIRTLIDRISVVDTYTVEVVLTAPSLMFLTLISNIVDPGALIVPKKHFESVGATAFAQKPIGSGPYKFVERQTGSQITLEKAFPQHFAVGRPRFERVVLRLVPEESTRLAMLKTGDADFIDVGIDKVAGLESEGFKVHKQNGLSPVYVIFQLRDGDPTQDANLRRALSQAINRDELNRTLMSGLARPTGNVWPGAGDAIPPTAFNLDEAKRTLAQTPYGPGKQQITLQMQVAPSAAWPQMLQLAQAVQDYWKRLGIQSSIIYRDFGATRTEWVAGGLPAPAVVFMNFDPQVDWHSVVATVWTCTGLFKNVCDPELDALHADWGRATTRQVYVAGANAHEKLMTDRNYVIPILAAQIHFASNDQIPDGYQPGNVVRGINVRAMVWNP